MKKHAIAIITAFALILTAASAFAAKEIETVSVKGQVSRSTGSADWKPLAKGDTLSAGDMIRTGAGAEAVIKWFGGNSIKISQLSDFTITAISKGPGSAEKSSFHLEKGRLLAKSKKLGDKSIFEVKTPYALCGVRGTTFTVEHETDKRSKFQVADGTIAVTAQGVTQLITDETWTQVELNKPPEEPLPLTSEDLGAIKQESQQMDEVLTGEAPAEQLTPGEAAALNDAADTVTLDNMVQDMENLIIENIITPSQNCCDY